LSVTEQSGRPLAWHLAALCVALLSPVLALLAYLAAQEVAADRARLETEAEGAARRIGITLDRGLTTVRATLDVLATSDYLRLGKFEGFTSRALQIHLSPRSAIVVRDAAGKLVASTLDSRAASFDDEESAAERLAIATRRPQVSGLLASASGQPGFVVAAPVPNEDGGISYVISMSLPTETLSSVFRGEKLPPGMVASVLDGDGTVLAQSGGDDRLVGRKLLPETALPEDESWIRARDLEGNNVMAAAVGSEASGWSAVVALPEPVFAAAVRRSLATAVGYGALLCALAVALALWFAAGIARPIATLAGRTLPDADTSAALTTPIREVNAVGRALASARAEAAAREREREELLLTLDRAQVRVQDLEGRILVWTTGCERLYGWTRSEAIGQVAHVLLRSQFPRPLPEIEAELSAHNEWQGEIRNVRRDGSVVVAACHWALRRDAEGQPIAVVEAANDVTGLRQAEAELRRSRNLLASVLSGSPEPIFAKDLDGRYALLNPPAAGILGVQPEAAIGRRTRELVGPELAAAMDAADQDVANSGQPRATEEEFLGADGRRRVLLSTKAPWRDAEGRIVGLVGVSRDITPRRDAELRLRETQAALFHVERRNAMGAMAAALSHELNQPLTAAANYAEAAGRLLRPGRKVEIDPDRAREAIEAATEELLRAGQILRGMREFIGPAAAQRSPVDVNAVIRQAVGLAMIGTHDPRITVDMRLAALAPQVLADRVQIEQVVVNLVRNAAEALAGAGGEISITTDARDGKVEICIIDTGPGLPPEVQAQLFRPFVSTKRDGMGIGLSVSHSIVERHGGTLSAAPNPGGGTVFCFKLPICPDPQP
jgi:two-component system sensor kinase FixL